METNTSFEIFAWAPCVLHFDPSLASTTGSQQQRTEWNLEVQEMVTSLHSLITQLSVPT